MKPETRPLVVVLGAIACFAIVVCAVLGMGSHGIDLAPVATIGGAAVGALATLAATREHEP